jgi:hypothetical protein
MFESLVVLDCPPGSKLGPGARLGGQRAAEGEASVKKNHVASHEPARKRLGQEGVLASLGFSETFVK